VQHRPPAKHLSPPLRVGMAVLKALRGAQSF